MAPAKKTVKKAAKKRVPTRQSGLATALRNAKPPTRRNTVDNLLARIKAEDPSGYRELLKALRDPVRVSQRAIADIMTDAGYPISNTAIFKWRHDNLREKGV